MPKKKQTIDKSQDVTVGRVIPENSDMIIKFVAAFRKDRFWANAYANGGILKGQDLFALMDLSPKALASQPETFRKVCESWVKTQELVAENNEAIDMPDKPTKEPAKQATTSPTGTGGRGYRRKAIAASWVASKGDEVRVIMEDATAIEKDGSWFVRALETDEETTWVTLARNKNGKIPQDALELDVLDVAAC